MPEASAKISGDNRHPEIKGRIEFYGVYGGTVVVAEVSGPLQNQRDRAGNKDFTAFTFMKEGVVPESQSSSLPM